ncbi:hypothetical protein [Luteimonas saliphila]|uniref:hypothetical protein n=1 Tax=Luteimonas saliphila TaxID=2804919 RepID=UPI00192DBA40|nr:hypothetical protein [Luteimonas saliphila]
MSGPVDVLAVIERGAALIVDMSPANTNSPMARELRETRAAVAELIEAASIYRKGQYHDPEVESSDAYRSRRLAEIRRLDAALARVTGSTP